MAEENKKVLIDSNSVELNVIKLEKLLPYRLLGSFFVFAFIVVVVSIILICKNDLMNKQVEDIKETFYVWAGDIGFTLDDVIITGRKRTSTAELNSIINLSRGDNILKIDVYKLKEDLENLPWVKKAVIRRSFMPNVLMIELKEKNVVAIWQRSEKFYPIDDDGDVINAKFRSQEPILLIVGEGAPKHLKKLFKIIKSKNIDYFKRIKVVNFISQRRWDFILDDIFDGITVKMPEDNIDAAWNKLIKLNETDGILKRKLTIIDLRLSGKVIVKLKKDGVKKSFRFNNKEHKI